VTVNALAAETSAPAAQARSIRPGIRFWLLANAIALLAVALAMRVWRLENIPGINGDEAWSGVQAARLAAGKSIEWWTPTGNPINVFFLFPLAGLHAAFAPSFVLLRMAALASGILALVANYALCRRVFDSRTAAVSTLLLAVLPIDVAYSRFAWDASQSLLATVFVLYLPLWHYRKGYDDASLPVAGMVALAAALLVHPTNLFAAPLLVVPIAYAWRRSAWKGMQQVAVPARPLTLGLLALGGIFTAYFAWRALSGTAATLRGPDDFFAFVQNYLRLFSGATVYEYISGVDAATGPLAWFAWLPAACKLGFGIAVVFGGWGMMRRLAADGTEHDVNLVVGWAVMLLGFFLVAGPRAIAPHLERYGICLVAPGAVVLARGLAWWIEPRQSHARAAAWILAASVWLFPATFYLGYFDFIERTGGQSHLTFRTAAVEPKLAALRYIRSHLGGGGSARIVATQWWNYWPIAYLASGDNDIRVLSGQAWQTASPPADDGRTAESWYVEFAGSPEEKDLLRRLGQSGKAPGRHVIFDYSGRPVLSVVGPAENPSKKN
jgi:hypothetical protein